VGALANKAMAALNEGREVEPVVSFARDIQSLFRDDDVESMRYAFDLSRYEDVKANAEGIYDRLSDGSMPCDGPWPEEQVGFFRQWMDEGCAP
jgi:hypothetical protein